VGSVTLAGCSAACWGAVAALPVQAAVAWVAWVVCWAACSAVVRQWAARPSRSGGGTHYAALASLGMMAFQAYQAWQRSQVAAPQQAPRTVDLLAGPEVEEHSHAILRALIAAAKADGRIDDAEKQMISTEIGRHTGDPQLQQWLDAEVAKPLDASEVAQSATDPGMAAEMYLASVMLVDDQQDAERNYLDELAAALNIDPDLQVHLEQQAKGGAA
jgi:uncharacterized membrane protein YebE (DUF533 family)